MRTGAIEHVALPRVHVRIYDIFDEQLRHESGDRNLHFVPGNHSRRDGPDHDRRQAVGDVLSQREGQMGKVHQRNTVNLRTSLRVRLDRDSVVVSRVEPGPDEVCTRAYVILCALEAISTNRVRSEFTLG